MNKSGDTREVLYDAEEHTALIESILAESHLKPYNVFRHIDIKGKRVVDLGCGDGALSRQSILKGADYVLGIDGKPDMIKIALELNSGFEGKIDYRQAFIEDIAGDQSFDIAIISYLLNNATSYDQLLQQCKTIATFLKKGGIAVIYNNNPYDAKGGDFTKYGFRKSLTGTQEGSPIIYDYRPAITVDIVNYYITPERHEEVFRTAGFSQFSWEPLQLWPGADEKFWNDYFNREHLPVIGMIAIK